MNKEEETCEMTSERWGAVDRQAYMDIDRWKREREREMHNNKNVVWRFLAYTEG